MGRVLTLIESGGPGGAERVVLALNALLRRRGHEVVVATLRTGWLTEELSRNGLRHILLQSPARRDFAFPIRLARILRQERIDVVHSHLLDSNFYAAIAARIAGTTHVATEHGDVHHTHPKKFLRVKLRSLSLLGSRIVAVSGYTADRIAELGVPRNRITVVGNPIDIAVFNETHRHALRAQHRTALAIPADIRFVWIHVANLRPVKDQATLLRGFAKALHRGPQALVIIGDGAERAALERLASELGITSSVHFLGFRNDVAEWLAVADGFVLSSLSEALPMSLLEATASGLLPVVPAVGGLPEVVKDGVTGYLFPSGDADALGAKMGDAVDDLALSSRLSAAAREFTATHFAAERVLDEYEKIYWNDL